MIDKVKEERPSSLIQLKLESICDNIDCGNSLWASYEGRYREMSEDEIRVFTAEFHFIANDTMNELSSIMKQLARASVHFKEKPLSHPSSRLMNR